jgi:hypothetical protein
MPNKTLKQICHPLILTDSVLWLLVQTDIFAKVKDVYFSWGLTT